MHVWTPPRGSKVVLAIGLIDPERASPEVRGALGEFALTEAYVRPFYEKFGIPWNEYRHLTVRLSDERLPAMVDEIERMTSHGVVGVRQSGLWWLEEPRPRATDRTAWFGLCSATAPRRAFSRVPEDRHYVRREMGESSYHSIEVASDRFRQVVEDAGLRGLGFLPLEDVDGWHQVWATSPLGRGLDHPLIDPAKIVATRNRGLPYYPERQWGEACAWVKYFWDDATIEHPLVARLVELGDDNLCRINGPERFVREHLPDADFAYFYWGWNPDGKLGRFGRRRAWLYCSHRAREVLVEAGVMQQRWFHASVSTVAAEKAGSAILDRTNPHPIPVPTFTEAEAAAERERREAARKANPPVLTQRRFTSIEMAARELRRRIEDGTATWTPFEAEGELLAQIQASADWGRLPEAWKALLPLLPVEVDREEEAEGVFEFAVAAPRVRDWLEGQEFDDDDPNERPSEDDLVIGTTIYGDWFAFRTSDPLLPADARVVLWDHETLCIEDQWSSVVAFVEFLIEVCDGGGRH